MASVTYDQVTKRFGDLTAVDSLDIEIFDKEFLIFVGPSGCGKSTSLRMLAGLEEVSEGQIFIGDRMVNNVAPKDRDVAMVFQSYALYPHMTVYDNMAFGLKLRGTAKDVIEERVRSTARELGIENLLDRRPRQLSGGQRQRVAVGRAIVREPKVFLMDEPLSNLDAKLRVEARAFISRLHQRLGTTFIYVTHDQVEAMTMGDRIAVLNLGQLQQVDTPQNLYNTPANIFVAGFIGSPAMNFFNGVLEKEESTIYVQTDYFRLAVPAANNSWYEPHLGDEIVFGIRPEDIHDPDYTPQNIIPSEVTASVAVVEEMGYEKTVYLEMGEGDNAQTFLARMDPRTNAAVGNVMTVVFNMDNMHIFDRKTERAIRGNGK
jgi:multiple sugar transport system ATP-binding protein